jgi:hypothetical protein
MDKLASTIVDAAFACVGTYVLAWAASKGWHHGKPK